MRTNSLVLSLTALSALWAGNSQAGLVSYTDNLAGFNAASTTTTILDFGVAANDTSTPVLNGSGGTQAVGTTSATGFNAAGATLEPNQFGSSITFDLTGGAAVSAIGASVNVGTLANVPPMFEVFVSGVSQGEFSSGSFIGFTNDMLAITSLAFVPTGDSSWAVSFPQVSGLQIGLVDQLPPPSRVPEPSSLAVFAIGMVGLVGGGIRRRRRVAKS